jgi:hypothetical protein
MTAVEWLIEEIHKNICFIPVHIQEQAKEMEKEQKKFIFECGRNFQLTGEGTFEEVYKETFKSE